MAVVVVIEEVDDRFSGEFYSSEHRESERDFRNSAEDFLFQDK